MGNILNDAMYPFGLRGNQFLSTKNSIYIQSEILDNNTIRVIECDIEEKWMKVREKRENEMDWIEMEYEDVRKGDVIDLNENGERWEGDSLNGNPFGYGCIYNSENQIIYSGFIFEGLKVCYGTELYGDVSLVEYEGEFYNGMRYGNGKLYNKKNELIYEGEWYMNNPLETSSVNIDRELKEEDIHFGLEEIVIGDNCDCDLDIFVLKGYHRLKSISIGKNSLSKIKELILDSNH